MRKLMLVILAVMVLLVTGCAADSRDYKGKKGKIVTRQPEDIRKMFDDGETFIVFAGTKDCDSCARYEPIVREFVDRYDVTFYYMPADDYESDTVKDIIYNYLYKLDLTPSTYIVKDGKAVDLEEGVIEYDNLVRWLQKHEFIY